MNYFDGQVAVITGAAAGIGLGMARVFSSMGMFLVMADIDEENLEAATGDLQAQGFQVEAVPTDVTDLNSLVRLRDRALSRFGAVHLLCNNAGGPLPRRISSLSAADWKISLDLNLFSVINGIQVFLPLLEEQGEGHINATASMSGLVPFPPVATYNVAKAGVVALMQTLAHELRAANSPVQVSLLCPGEVATYGVKNSLRLAQESGYKPTSEEEKVAASAQVGILRSGIEPDEVARILLTGIQQGRFWIFTHDSWVDGPLKQLHDSMTDTGTLPGL